MGRIDDLVKQMCPDGVEQVKFVDYSNVKYGFSFDSSKFSEDASLIPLIRIRDVVPGKASTYYTGDYSDEYIVKAGDILVGMDGNFNLGVWNDVDGLLNQRVCKLYSKDESKLLNGFIKHYMKPLFLKIEKSTAGGSVKHLSAKAINSIEIPLPPLAIQQQIVEVLDLFTYLLDNLQTELGLREKQMTYYREKLLSFEGEEVEWKPIKEFGKLVRGNGLQKKDFVDEGVGCIHYGQIYTRFGLWTNKTLSFVDSDLAEKLTKVEPGNLVIACTSENVEDVCKPVVWLGDQNIVTGGHACVLKHHENPKYIGYCFTTHSFHDQKRKHAYGAKVVDIKTDRLGEIKIPLPPLSRQQQIVEVLDTFEALIANIKQEITLRQKQYEFYREKLLTFKAYA